MKVAFLFAGQGSQKVGMGQDLYDNHPVFKEVVDQVALDFDVKQLMFEGPIEQLSQTRYTQPCMATFAAGVIAILKQENIVPDYVAGLSLGEYSALHAAGVFDRDAFVKLVAFRGREMEKAAEGIPCKMSAVLGLDSKVLAGICEEITAANPKAYVTVSNYNCTGQYVICGDLEAVEMAEAKAKEAGAKRCMPLKVSGPFHTKFMEPAGNALDTYMNEITFGDMQVPVIFNTTASTLEEGVKIKDLLVKQVQSSIYMEDTILFLEKQGVDTIIEIGPGKTLCGFVKKTAKNMQTYCIEDMQGLEDVIKSFKKEA